MTLFNAANTPPQMIVSQVVMGLLQVRKGIEAAEELYAFSAGVSSEELQALPPDGPGFSQADADAIRSACADAFALAELYRKGTTTQSYPDGYVLGATQQRVIAGRVM